LKKKEKKMTLEFFDAVYRGDSLKVHQCLENDDSLKYKENEFGLSGIHIAAEKGFLEMVQYFLERGMDVNTQTSKQLYTPLMIASKRNQKHIVSFLLSQNANSSLLNYKNWTAIMYAISKSNVEIITILIEHGDIFTEKQLEMIQEKENLVEAAYLGKLDHVKFYIEQKKIHPDNPLSDKDGANALMRASHQGHLDIVKYLIQKALANINYQSKDGSTALMWASRKQRMDVVKFLLENGANTQITDVDGWTALTASCRRGNLEAVKELVKFIKDINYRESKFKNTALMYACRYGCIDVVKFLVSLGANFEIPDHLNYTCLMRAVQYGHNNVVEYLLSEGANYKKKSTTRVNLEKIIKTNNNVEALSILRKYTNSVDTVTVFTKTV
jgi:ankyrin repeat protein